LQAIGLGLLGSLAEARDVVRRSFDVKTYTPQQAASWQAPYEKFVRLLP
jgi:rhamnulokinase